MCELKYKGKVKENKYNQRVDVPKRKEDLEVKNEY